MVPTSVACKWPLSGASTACIGARCVLPSSVTDCAARDHPGMSSASLSKAHSRVAAMVSCSLERALKSLGMDHADIPLLGLWNKDVSPAIFDQALRLRERGSQSILGWHFSLSLRTLRNSFGPRLGTPFLWVSAQRTINRGPHDLPNRTAHPMESDDKGEMSQQREFWLFKCTCFGTLVPLLTQYLFEDTGESACMIAHKCWICIAPQWHLRRLRSGYSNSTTGEGTLKRLLGGIILWTLHDIRRTQRPLGVGPTHR